MEKIRSKYALPCSMVSIEDFSKDDLFFVTFNTRDETEALRLASCVCGPESADKSLVIITEKGHVFPYL